MMIGSAQERGGVGAADDDRHIFRCLVVVVAMCTHVEKDINLGLRKLN
jgi:hypothetical protein